MTNEELWKAVLGDLELELSKPNFNTWFKNTFIVSYNKEDLQVIIGVPNAFTQTWLQNKYHKAILGGLNRVTDKRIKKIIYRVEMTRPVENFAASNVKADQQPTDAGSAIAHKQEGKKIGEGIGLNSRYVFESFIVGGGNELAHAACQAVVAAPGEKYNPLFIYGGVGLGKTHLLQAVGNEILKAGKAKRVAYITAEDFVNAFVQSLKDGSGKDFKNHYRTLDVLLVDDVQFLGGKEKTREEFFHTFNTLHQHNKQLVFTSDRPPKAIRGLEDRIVSRLGMGMIADVTPPDLETRRAILETKIADKSLNLDDKIVEHLAMNFQKNVRELEGALNKIIAYSEFYNRTCTLEEVTKIVSSLASQNRRGAVTAKQLVKMVADFYEIKMDDLIAGGRRKELSVPRQIAMYLLREELDCSYPTIGDELGGRDHTTAMHAYKKITKEVEQEGRIKQEIDLIKERLHE
ncbi:MAG: chromosomal replication initiator protein DnaA [Chloroflexota bacterium]|nr:chromosomal replication initiator protein DnaA [Chloroflexota bacterium]